jgi:hypothetical protein
MGATRRARGRPFWSIQAGPIGRDRMQQDTRRLAMRMSWSAPAGRAGRRPPASPPCRCVRPPIKDRGRALEVLSTETVVGVQATDVAARCQPDPGVARCRHSALLLSEQSELSGFELGVGLFESALHGRPVVYDNCFHARQRLAPYGVKRLQQIVSEIAAGNDHRHLGMTILVQIAIHLIVQNFRSPAQLCPAVERARIFSAKLFPTYTRAARARARHVE